MLWVGLRMSSVPKPGWSSGCLCQIQLPSLSRSGLKVPGGVVVWWLRPILVFSLSLTASGWVGGATAYLGGATAYLVGVLDEIKVISAQLGLGFGLSLPTVYHTDNGRG